MLSSRARNRLYDLIQHCWVYTCLATTTGASAFLGYQLWYYFVHLKPIKKEAEEQFRAELLKEGRMLKDMAKEFN